MPWVYLWPSEISVKVWASETQSKTTPWGLLCGTQVKGRLEQEIRGNPHTWWLEPWERGRWYGCFFWAALCVPTVLAWDQPLLDVICVITPLSWPFRDQSGCPFPGSIPWQIRSRFSSYGVLGVGFLWHFLPFVFLIYRGECFCQELINSPRRAFIFILSRSLHWQVASAQ